MFDKILAAVSLLTLITSVSVVVWFVPEPDLMIITIIVLMMAVFDFYLMAFRRKNSND